MEEFLRICKVIAMPISMDKTVYACTLLTFLGFLIDTVNQWILIPCKKLAKGLNMISNTLEKYHSKKAANRKLTVLQLQKICGFLNFLGRAIIPGRAFTRRLYSYLCNKNLQQHHHIRMKEEMMLDLQMWKEFLLHQETYCRNFMDFSKVLTYQDVQFAMDALRNVNLGFRGHCGTSWMQGAWNSLIKKFQPSIEYLELFALVAGVIAWGERFSNRRILLRSDNLSICYMVNQTTSKCKNCMVLIRKLILHCLIHNIKINVQHLPSCQNGIADSLSRFEMKRFAKITEQNNLVMEESPTPIPDSIWPFDKIWTK